MYSENFVKMKLANDSLFLCELFLHLKIFEMTIMLSKGTWASKYVGKTFKNGHLRYY